MAASRGRQQGYDSVCACLLAAWQRCVQLNYGAASCARARMCRSEPPAAAPTRGPQKRPQKRPQGPGGLAEHRRAKSDSPENLIFLFFLFFHSFNFQKIQYSIFYVSRQKKCILRKLYILRRNQNTVEGRPCCAACVFDVTRVTRARAATITRYSDYGVVCLSLMKEDLR